MDQRVIQEPIRINNNAIAVVHIFTRTSDFGELWMSDDEQYMLENHDNDAKSAKQFIEQLCGYENMRFLIALRAEADSLIKEWEKRKA